MHKNLFKRFSFITKLFGVLFIVVFVISCATAVDFGNKVDKDKDLPVLDAKLSINLPKLEDFPSSRTVDPENIFDDKSIPVKPSYNGFVYPSDARVKPTNAYLDFWHPETKVYIQIFVEPEIANLMNINGHISSPNHDIYWPVNARIYINDRVYEYYEVGMRRKGNTSRGHQFWDNDSEKFIESFSFKLRFDETWTKDVYDGFGLKKTWDKTDEAYKIRDDRTFLGSDEQPGLKKLDFKYNKTADKSMVNQAFIFSLFQKEGLITQNSTLTQLKINDEKFGVGALNEPIDKHLLRRYFSKDAAKGDLYKVGWGPISPGGEGRKGSLMYEDLIFVGNDDDSELISGGIVGEKDKFNGYKPGYDAKEFDGKAIPKHKNLINLMKVLKENEGKTPEGYKEALEGIVDIDNFLNYAAISYLTANPDDLRNNGNNYYIFFNPEKDNKAYFLPYDYDWALGLAWDGTNDNAQMGNLPPAHTKMQGNGRVWQEVRLYYYTIINPTNDEVPFTITRNDDYYNQYLGRLNEVMDGDYFTISNFNKLYNTYKNNYVNDVAADVKSAYSGFNSTILFSTLYNNLKNSIDNAN